MADESSTGTTPTDNTNDNSGDDKSTPPTPTNLDEAHDQALHNIESEDENGKGDSDATDDKDTSGEGEDTDTGDDTTDSDKDTSDKEETDTTDTGEDDATQEDETEDETDKPADTTSELDTDIKKPGEGKVAFTNFEGETIYLNSVDEMPDDFEPKSYKEFAVAMSKLNAKSIHDEQLAADKATAEAAQAETQAVKNLQDSWGKEVDMLTKSGALPKDDKERQGVVDAVYNYMAEQLNKGIIIDSWEQAFKSYSYDQTQVKNKEQQKKTDEAKKKRGSMVQSGGTPAGSTAGKPIEGPPPGVTLDQIHSHVLETL